MPEWIFRLKGDHDKIGDSPGFQRIFMTSNSVTALDATIAGGRGPWLHTLPDFDGYIFFA